ncbi:hypothetical protein O1L60_37290 [Streptomyces diastatochromogenes]|nr:hypothetical protein [Streptomyces diastatochromogenes]
MSSRIPWRVRAGTAALTVLAGVGAFTAPGSAAAASPPGAGRQTVSYHGYRVEIPADWQVVDLAENPRACLRFDRPAVYLGEPSEQSDCPAHLLGRTAGLVVEPLTARSAGQATAATARAPRGKATAPAAVSSNDTIQIAVEDAGVLVTAAHTPATEHLVRDVLASAALTPDARRAELPRAAQRPEAASWPRPDRSPAATWARASTPAPRPPRPP